MTLTTLKTPAFTTATACSSAETGVGATIAAGSQRWKGISAALPMPYTVSASSAASSLWPSRPWRTPPGVKSVVPARYQMKISAGSRKTVDVPSNRPR